MVATPGIASTSSSIPGTDRWWSLVTEAPLEASLPIIDAHHHIFEAPAANRQFLYSAQRFANDVRASGHNVVASVYVETRTAFREDGPLALRSVGETRYADAIAERHRSGGPAIAAAIVGSADLKSPALRDILQAHIDAAPHRFRGVRQTIAWDADPAVRFRHGDPVPGMAGDPEIRNGVRELGRLGLVCDVLLFHPQLEELAELADECTNTLLILNHLGCPLGVGPYAADRAGVFERWRRGMAALARRPNVYVKLGGMGMRITGFGWHERAEPPGSQEFADATAPYYLHALDCFGAGRCMFESNFPPDGLSAPYGVIWNAFKRIAQHLPGTEKHQVFFGTANQVYRLGL